MKAKRQYKCYDKNNHIVINAILEIELRKEDSKPVLSICGEIRKHRAWLCGGQCLDTMLEYYPQLMNNPDFAFWFKMWSKYHLNDMNAGTVKQEEALKKAYSEGIIKGIGANNYDECCNYLKSVGLYEVKIHNKPYKYGHRWLYRAIPKKDLENIKNNIQKETKEWIKVCA